MPIEIALPPLAQTPIGNGCHSNLQLKCATPSLPAHASELFHASTPTSPVFPDERPYGEYDIDRDDSKFVAGWPCLQIMAGDAAPGTRTSTKDSKPSLFSAANPATAEVHAAFSAAYANHAHDSASTRQEIGQVILQQTAQTAQELDRDLPLETLTRMQEFRIDTTTGLGLPYLHDRDEAHAAILDKVDTPIHTFLPGYATGDRYALILATLINSRRHVSIAYSHDKPQERKSAEEAASVIRKALQASGDNAASDRVSLYVYHGDDLKGARESLDAPTTRAQFSLIDGPSTPLAGAEDARDTHVFHISATTELIAREFRHAADDAPQLHQDICNRLEALVPAQTRAHIDALVDQVIAEQKIEKGAAGLWIADREFANAREAEAISRPRMFEQIAEGLKQSGTPVYCIADTYINRAYDEHGKDRLTDRQPYRPTLHPHVGRFWAAEVDGHRPLQARENQWYFMHRLLEKVGGPLIGIRSGALEPVALMGHQVIYLEHEKMFTPERHACWQGIIPYHRLITRHTTGYLHKQSETFRTNNIRQLVGENQKIKQTLGANPEQLPPQSSQALQQRLATVEEDLQRGVLSRKELDLLIAMVGSRATAWSTATQNNAPDRSADS